MGGRRRRHEPAGERPAPDADAAMEIAARFLGTRPRTRRELERRLRRAAADDEVIATTLERLAHLGYLDDLAFARWWAEQRDCHAPRGRRMVEAELRQHGVPRDVLEALRDDATEAPADEDEPLPASDEERAEVALARHLRGRPFPDDRAAVQRLGTFLLRRGFDPETVRATLRVAAESTPGGSTGDPDGTTGTDG